MLIRKHTQPGGAAREDVDLAKVRELVLRTVQYHIEEPLHGHTDFDGAWSLVDWVTADGRDHAVRIDAIKAVARECWLRNRQYSVKGFLDGCANMERFLLGERPSTPDRTAAGR